MHAGIEKGTIRLLFLHALFGFHMVNNDRLGKKKAKILPIFCSLLSFFA
jgi:hypothetical protein